VDDQHPGLAPSALQRCREMRLEHLGRRDASVTQESIDAFEFTVGAGHLREASRRRGRDRVRDRQQSLRQPLIAELGLSKLV